MLITTWHRPRPIRHHHGQLATGDRYQCRQRTSRRRAFRAKAALTYPIDPHVGWNERPWTAKNNMNGLSRRTLLCGAAALGGLGARHPTALELQDAACGEHALPAGSNQPPLAALAARQNRFFGAAVKDQLSPMPSFGIWLSSSAISWSALTP